MAVRMLVDAGYWDEFWRETTLPAEMTKEINLYTTAIIDALDRYLPAGRDLSALEVGGAPGQYLAYLHRHFGYRVTALDYSPLGCSLTRRNFDLLGIPGEVLGCPSFLGVNRMLAARLTPEKLRTHNLELMDCRAWSAFECEFQLETLFRGYVGGFETSLLSQGNGMLATSLRVLGRVLNKRSLRLLRRFNSRAWSGHALGFYRAPGSGELRGHRLNRPATGGHPTAVPPDA